jgi:RND family efflux transporter MFP subunit
VRLAPLVLAATLAGCSSGSSAEGGASTRGARRGPQAIPVAAVEARPRDLARTVVVTGPVEPLRTVPVNSLTAGTVLRVVVQEGDRVAIGQLMAELDARETSAQLERARALLANAEAAFRRAEELRARDLVSTAELDAARSAFETAKADAELWRTRADFTQIKAPAAGVVTVKHVERGAAVSAHEAMFEIAEDATLVVRVRVSELDVVNLDRGRPVTVQVDAYPGAHIPGRIRRIFPTADATSRLVPVEVELGVRPAGVRVRPGYLARVEFAIERRDGVLAIPTAAIGVSEGAQFVYVVSADTLLRKPVRTGLTAAGWVEVLDGLSSGERVVSSGHVNLRPGARVRVSEVLGGEGS